MSLNKNRSTFIGCDSAYSDAAIVLFGAPFDGTTSYRPGTRFGPRVMRAESEGIETYSPYQDADLLDYAVCDTGDIELPFGNTKEALRLITECAGTILSAGKFPLMFGGEHLVTLGAVEAAVKKYKDIHVIHFDAHADLRNDYLGEPLSHATVMRRIWDLVGDGRIYQFGIRSGDRDEFTFAREHVKTSMFGLDGLQETLVRIGDNPLYVSIDLDVLDPSVMPGTGTPEPGGVSFDMLLQAILLFKNSNIVGADVCEFCPPCDPGGISAMAACKTVRELLLVIGNS